MSSKILVIGRVGQVGHELARAAWPASLAPEFVERDQLDLGQPADVTAAVAAMRPRLVINAGAYTAVDQAETERVAAFAVNRDGPAALAEVCREIGAALIHFSTDYVFLRTSWVYSAVGHNFVKTMLRLGAERDELRIVDDQHGAPTAAAELAHAAIHIAAALAAGKEDGFGTFNFTGAGATTWHGFAREIFAGAAERGAKVPLRVQPIATADYPLPAPRPRNSLLDCAKIARSYGLVARPWQESLSDCLDELIGPVRQLRSAQGAGR
jgi:dTDP-4-dehydrorhamnose reductase